MSKVITLFSLIFLITLSTVTASGAEIIVEDVTGIFSMRPDTGAIFMKIQNTSDNDDALIGATVDIKDVRVELHDIKDGQMVKIEKIPVPAKTTVELKRGSFHIMLFNLPIELRENEEFRLTLTFEKAGEITVPAKLSSSRHKMMHHH